MSNPAPNRLEVSPPQEDGVLLKLSQLKDEIVAARPEKLEELKTRLKATLDEARSMTNEQLQALLEKIGEVKTVIETNPDFQDIKLRIETIQQDVRRRITALLAQAGPAIQDGAADIAHNAQSTFEKLGDNLAKTWDRLKDSFIQISRPMLRMLIQFVGPASFMGTILTGALESDKAIAKQVTDFFKEAGDIYIKREAGDERLAGKIGRQHALIQGRKKMLKQEEPEGTDPDGLFEDFLEQVLDKRNASNPTTEPTMKELSIFAETLWKEFAAANSVPTAAPAAPAPQP